MNDLITDLLNIMNKRMHIKDQNGVHVVAYSNVDIIRMYGIVHKISDLAKNVEATDFMNEL